MGTEIRHVRGKGMTMQQAWKRLVDEDTYENGHGYYNSTLALCSLNKEVKELPKDDKVWKGEAYGKMIQKPIPNTNKVKSKVTNYPQKGAREWVTEFYAVDFTGYEVSGISSPSQTECIKKARAYVESKNNRLWIHIRKKLKEGKSEVAQIEYKNSSNEKLGEWEFVAGTAC